MAMPAQAWAQLNAVSEVRVAPTFSFEIPEKLGSLETLSPGTSGAPTIIHIQEAHGNYEVQKKIESLLLYIEGRYGSPLILLEGNAFKLKPELMQFFPENPKATRIAAETLAKKGIVTGPELYFLKNPAAQAYGIENLETYNQNGRAFVEVLKEQQKTKAFVEKMKLQMERLTSPYLNQALRQFLKREETYEAGQIPLDQWLEEIKVAAQKHVELDLTHPGNQLDWPMLLRFFTLKRFESQFDQTTFLTERAKFLKYVHSDEIKNLLNQSLSQQPLPDPQTDLLFERMVASLPKNFNYAEYPNVNLFIGHLILRSELKGDKLMREISQLTDQISTKLAREENEKVLIATLKENRLLNHLFNLQLTPQDYAQIHPNSLLPSNFVKRFKTLNKDLRVRDSEFEHLADLDSLFHKALEFYRGTKERDPLMLENIEKRLKETGKATAVVITGGFHAQPFQDYFQQKNYHYALITPKITKINGPENYQQLMLNSATHRLPEMITNGKALANYAINQDWLNSQLQPVLSTAKNENPRSEARQSDDSIHFSILNLMLRFAEQKTGLKREDLLAGKIAVLGLETNVNGALTETNIVTELKREKRDVLGVDPQAKDRFKEGAYKASVTRMPKIPRGSVDLAVSVGLFNPEFAEKIKTSKEIQSIEEFYAKAAAETARILKPSGRFLVSTGAAEKNQSFLNAFQNHFEIQELGTGIYLMSRSETSFRTRSEARSEKENLITRRQALTRLVGLPLMGALLGGATAVLSSEKPKKFTSVTLKFEDPHANPEIYLGSAKRGRGFNIQSVRPGQTDIELSGGGESEIEKLNLNLMVLDNETEEKTPARGYDAFYIQHRLKFSGMYEEENHSAENIKTLKLNGTSVIEKGKYVQEFLIPFKGPRITVELETVNPNEDFYFIFGFPTVESYLRSRISQSLRPAIGGGLAGFLFGTGLAFEFIKDKLAFISSKISRRTALHAAALFGTMAGLFGYWSYSFQEQKTTLSNQDRTLSSAEDLLGHTHTPTRETAARQLGNILKENPQQESLFEGLKALSIASKEPHENVRNAALEALQGIDAAHPNTKPALEGLMLILDADEDYDIRTSAAFALRMLKDEDSVSALYEALEGENGGVEVNAVKGLANIGMETQNKDLKKNIIDRLSKRLQRIVDEHAQGTFSGFNMRDYASALFELGEKEKTIQMFMEAIKKAPSSTRNSLIWDLTQTPDLRVIEVLEEYEKSIPGGDFEIQRAVDRMKEGLETAPTRSEARSKKSGRPQQDAFSPKKKILLAVGAALSLGSAAILYQFQKQRNPPVAPAPLAPPTSVQPVNPDQIAARFAQFLDSKAAEMARTADPHLASFEALRNIFKTQRSVAMQGESDLIGLNWNYSRPQGQLRISEPHLSIDTEALKEVMDAAETNPFYRDILTAVVIKQGARLNDYSKDKAFYARLLMRTLDFYSLQPFNPKDPAHRDLAKQSAAHLVKSEAVGYQNALDYLDSKYNLETMNQEEMKLPQNSGLRAFVHRFNFAFSRIAGREGAERDRILEIHLFLNDLRRTRPEIVQAIFAAGIEEGTVLRLDGPVQGQMTLAFFNFLRNPSYLRAEIRTKFTALELEDIQGFLKWFNIYRFQASQQYKNVRQGELEEAFGEIYKSLPDFLDHLEQKKHDHFRDNDESFAKEITALFSEQNVKQFSKAVKKYLRAFNSAENLNRNIPRMHLQAQAIRLLAASVQTETRMDRKIDLADLIGLYGEAKEGLRIHKYIPLTLNLRSNEPQTFRLVSLLLRIAFESTKKLEAPEINLTVMPGDQEVILKLAHNGKKETARGTPEARLLANEIVETLKGSISGEPLKPAGFVFTLKLPKSRSEARTVIVPGVGKVAFVSAQQLAEKLLPELKKIYSYPTASVIEDRIHISYYDSQVISHYEILDMKIKEPVLNRILERIFWQPPQKTEGITDKRKIQILEELNALVLAIPTEENRRAAQAFVDVWQKEKRVIRVNGIERAGVSHYQDGRLGAFITPRFLRLTPVFQQTILIQEGWQVLNPERWKIYAETSSSWIKMSQSVRRRLKGDYFDFIRKEESYFVETLRYLVSFFENNRDSYRQADEFLLGEVHKAGGREAFLNTEFSKRFHEKQRAILRSELLAVESRFNNQNWSFDLMKWGLLRVILSIDWTLVKSPSNQNHSAIALFLGAAAARTQFEYARHSPFGIALPRLNANMPYHIPDFTRFSQWLETEMKNHKVHEWYKQKLQTVQTRSEARRKGPENKKSTPQTLQRRQFLKRAAVTAVGLGTLGTAAALVWENVREKAPWEKFSGLESSNGQQRMRAVEKAMVLTLQWMIDEGHPHPEILAAYQQAIREKTIEISKRGRLLGINQGGAIEINAGVLASFLTGIQTVESKDAFLEWTLFLSREAHSFEVGKKYARFMAAKNFNGRWKALSQVFVGKMIWPPSRELQQQLAQKDLALEIKDLTALILSEEVYIAAREYQALTHAILKHSYSPERAQQDFEKIKTLDDAVFFRKHFKDLFETQNNLEKLIAFELNVLMQHALSNPPRTAYDTVYFSFALSEFKRQDVDGKFSEEWIKASSSYLFEKVLEYLGEIDKLSTADPKIVPLLNLRAEGRNSKELKQQIQKANEAEDRWSRLSPIDLARLSEITSMGKLSAKASEDAEAILATYHRYATTLNPESAVETERSISEARAHLENVREVPMMETALRIIHDFDESGKPLSYYQIDALRKFSQFAAERAEMRDVSQASFKMRLETLQTMAEKYTDLLLIESLRAELDHEEYGRLIENMLSRLERAELRSEKFSVEDLDPKIQAFLNSETGAALRVLFTPASAIEKAQRFVRIGKASPEELAIPVLRSILDTNGYEVNVIVDSQEEADQLRAEMRTYAEEKLHLRLNENRFKVIVRNPKGIAGTVRTLMDDKTQMVIAGDGDEEDEIYREFNLLPESIHRVRLLNNAHFSVAQVATLGELLNQKTAQGIQFTEDFQDSRYTQILTSIKALAAILQAA